MFIQSRPEMLPGQQPQTTILQRLLYSKHFFSYFFSPPRLRIFERKTPVFHVLPASPASLTDTLSHRRRYPNRTWRGRLCVVALLGNAGVLPVPQPRLLLADFI